MPTARAERAYRDLMSRYRERAMLESCATVLVWDEETYLPPDGVELRGEQHALLARLEHERATDPAIAELLAEAEAGAFDPDGVEASNLRDLRREHELAIRVPASLVEEAARISPHAQQAWEEARDGADAAPYVELLGRVVTLVRAQADCVRGDRSRYEACLDDWEHGLTDARLDALLGALVPEASALARRAAGRAAPSALPAVEIPVEVQRLLVEDVAHWFAFDFDGGRIDEATHPSTIRIGPGDVRLTTRFDPQRPLAAILATMHELGHGLYDQNLPAEHFGAPIGEPSSYGLHESQARLIENRLGRSEAFWRGALPRLTARAPALAAWRAQDVTRSLDRVDLQASRIGADELTYDLHIAVRVELERALIEDRLAVADVAEAWDDAYGRWLTRPATPRRGWLDDGHWAAAMFGYFPTYTLGNLGASQLFAAARRELPALDEHIAALELAPLVGWLSEHVHRHGGRLDADEILVRATGRPLGVDDHLATLAAKLA